MEFDGFLNGWTDVSDDVDLAEGVRCSRGLPGDSMQDLVAKIGVLTFAMDNSVMNSAGLVGYYTPGHENCRAGFARNVAVRFSVVVAQEGSPNELVYPQFTGRLLRATPTPGEDGVQVVQCTVVDYMDQLARRSVNTLPVQINIADHEAFGLIVDSMPVQPRATQIPEGFDTLGYVFDTMRDEKATAMSECQRLAQSTLARIWVNGSGTLTYEPRSIRARNTTTNVLTVEAEDMSADQGLTVTDDREDVINHVQVTLHPRAPLGSAEVLYALDTPILLEPNLTIHVRGLFIEPGLRQQRAGAASVIEPVSGVDYLANSAADGSGVDRTSALTVATEITANSVLFTITSSAAAWLTTLQARGVGLFDSANTAVQAQDADSIADVGENLYSLDMPYLSDIALGSEVTQYLLSLARQNSKRAISVRVMLNGLSSAGRASQFALRDVSHRVGVREGMTALPISDSSGSYIDRLNWEVDADGMVWVTWFLAKSDSTQYWHLEIPGRSELGLTTRLGFSLIVGHTDVEHSDDHGDVAHTDVAHSDSHTDTAHEDSAHADSGHTDVAHSDVAHSDVAHTDFHVDEHQDVWFDDSHGDSPHGDAHNDFFDGGHGDGHIDNAHNDSHVDIAHQDFHGDLAHNDVAHSDVNHSDVAHQDTSHTDGAHADTAHGDVAHSDTLHTDTPHTDDHGDRAHGDVN